MPSQGDWQQQYSEHCVVPILKDASSQEALILPRSTEMHCVQIRLLFMTLYMCGESCIFVQNKTPCLPKLT